MKTIRCRNLSLVLAGLVLVFTWGGCSTAPKADYIEMPLGSSYTNSRTDTGSFGSGTVQVTVKREERMWEGKPLAAFVSTQGATLVNSAGAWVVMVGPDGKPVFSYDPPVNYDYPVVVGKTWTKSSRVTVHAQNQTIPFDYTAKVEAYEDITVPAGTFKAFKIVTSDTLGNENVQWWNPEPATFVKQILRRTDKHRQGPGMREIVLVSRTVGK